MDLLSWKSEVPASVTSTRLSRQNCLPPTSSPEEKQFGQALTSSQKVGSPWREPKPFAPQVELKGKELPQRQDILKQRWQAVSSSHCVLGFLSTCHSSMGKAAEVNAVWQGCFLTALKAATKEQLSLQTRRQSSPCSEYRRNMALTQGWLKKQCHSSPITVPQCLPTVRSTS